MFKVASSFIVAALVAAGLVVTNAPARAQAVPDPCDFITGGGFVIKDSGAKANFGAHGGCKQGAFWGHVNYVDHGGFNGTTPYHVSSFEITAYLEISPNTRDICGSARTNAGETVQFRVRMQDNKETGTPDRFGIRLSNSYQVVIRELGDGNIELHKDNPSTSPPPAGSETCAGVPPPDGITFPDVP